MKLAPRLAIGLAASLAAHAAIARVLELLPPVPPPRRPARVAVRLVTAPLPPPEPPAEPPPPPAPVVAPVVPPPIAPPPVAPPRASPRRPATPAKVTTAPRDGAPTDAPADLPPTTTPGPSTAPVFGVTMESTSPGGSGPAVPVGNTTRATPGAGAGGDARPLAGPAAVAAYQATKQPLPIGRCFGTYTDAARAAGVEGTVVLDLVVDERGRARDVVVVTGLPEGLSAAAVAAAKACRFTPGERDGVAVPVKVRGFKIRFVLSEAP